MATITKRPEKIDISDWRLFNKAVEDRSKGDFHKSLENRSTAKEKTISAHISQKWDMKKNEEAIANHLEEVQDLKALLEKSLQDSNREIKSLENSKTIIYQLINIAHDLSSKINRSITLRDRREGVEYVNDEAEKNLRTLQKFLNELKVIYQDLVNEINSSHKDLSDFKYKLVNAIQDHQSSIDIDLKNLELKSVDDKNVSYKPFFDRQLNNYLSKEEWLTKVQEYYCHAQSLVNKSKHLRDRSHHILNEVENSIFYKIKQVKASLAMRNHEYELTLESLKDQRKSIQEEIERMKLDLDKLDKTIDSLRNNEMITMTRLDNRNFRLGTGLVRDFADTAQRRSLEQLNACRNELRNQQKLNREALSNMEFQLSQLNEEIDLKSDSKHLDQEISGVLDRISFDRNYEALGSIIELKRKEFETSPLSSVRSCN